MPNYKKVHLAHRNMLSRCYNPRNASYEHYGLRGISVCDVWRNSRDTFVQWALCNGHADNLSLDRIDNNAGYSPENCRWASTREQLLNQRRNRLVTHEGTTAPLSVWAEKIAVNVDTLWRRIVTYKIDTARALSPTSLRKTANHGTRYMYDAKGCRCNDCTKANTVYLQKSRARVADRLQGVER